MDQRAQNLVQSRNKVDKLAQEYAAATGEAEMAEAKAVRQGEEAEAFRRIADEKRLLAYQLADKWTGMHCLLPVTVSCQLCLLSEGVAYQLADTWTGMCCLLSYTVPCVKVR